MNVTAVFVIILFYLKVLTLFQIHCVGVQCEMTKIVSHISFLFKATTLSCFNAFKS